MEKPFKIGIWIDENTHPQLGGGFSYTDRLIREINLKKFDSRIEILFVGINLKNDFDKKTIKLFPVKENFLKRKIFNFFHKFFRIKLLDRNIKSQNDLYIEVLNKNNIQLLFYSSPYVPITNFPYIITHWDLGHKTTYPFPELSMNGQFKEREDYYEISLGQALFICSESEEGKDEIIRNYNIFSDKVKILPMFPGIITDETLEEIKPSWINKEVLFFIYPAQFWAHKNHYNLIVAFKAYIKDGGNENHYLILSGSDKGNLQYIVELINELGITKNIIIPGFIKNQELKWLYKNSLGLIYPSFLGPTNMPLLEALALGCEIACSNLKGHQELLKDNAIYFDPKNIDEIKDAIIILSNRKRKQIGQVKQSLEKEISILENIFLESINVRKTWGHLDKKN